MRIDASLFVGACAFRELPSSVDDLQALRLHAELDRAVATGFRSIFYFDPIDGLAKDLAQYETLAEWLYFWAVVNPEFPQLEALANQAKDEDRIVGLRLFPGLHGYRLDSERLKIVVDMSVERGLPINITARLFDIRVAPKMVTQEDIDLSDLAAFLERTKKTTAILSMFFFNELTRLKVDWHDLPNVYIDLGCCKPTAASFDDLPSWFPTNRVLFGTGAPYYYWAGSRLALEGAQLPHADKQAILGNNAKEVFSWI